MWFFGVWWFGLFCWIFFFYFFFSFFFFFFFAFLFLLTGLTANALHHRWLSRWRAYKTLPQEELKRIGWIKTPCTASTPAPTPSNGLGTEKKPVPDELRELEGMMFGVEKMEEGEK